jgi:glycosyltransferase involved in cell wall biosynthesis
MGDINRVCFIAPAHSIHTQRWVRAFALKDEYDVTLLSPYGPPPSWADLADARITWMRPASRKDPAPRRYLRVCSNYLSMRRLLFQGHYDLVHVHQLPPPATMLFFWRIPRLVVSTWGADIVDLDQRSRRHLKELSRRFVLRQAVAVTATSRFLADATKRYLSEGRQVSVVPFGVDLSRFSRDPVDRPPAPPVRLIITKHLTPKYGIDYLLQAIKTVYTEFRDLELLVIGDGEQKGQLQALTQKLGLDAIVRFQGAVPHDQIPWFLERSHIYVMPSINDSETFGVAAVEAQAMGLPVIASAVGGVPEVLIDGHTGLLVPPRDVRALANAILRLAADPEMREKMGSEGRKFVREKYDWRVSVQSMERVYRRVLENAK